MSTDLRGQLQQLGLVTADDVKAHDEKRTSAKNRKPGASSGKKRQRAKPVESNAFTGPLKTSVSESLPPRQRVMELVKQHACADKRCQLEYFFTDTNNAVRSVIANKVQQKQLAEGVLVVVKPQQNRDPYVLIPANVAQVIIELMPQRIVLWHGQEQRLRKAQETVAEPVKPE